MYQKVIFLYCLIPILQSCAPHSNSYASLKTNLEPGQWESLFDGTELKLVALDGSRPSRDNWRIANGNLETIPGQKVDLRSENLFANFEMEFEFSVKAGANSGVKYLINPALKNVGPEYQIIDEVLHPDGAKGAKRHTSAVYDLFAPLSKNTNPLGEYNRGKIVVNGSIVEHWLNGNLSVRYDIDSIEFEKARQESKFKNELKFARYSPSYVLVQHHGEAVSFRGIRIRQLP